MRYLTFALGKGRLANKTLEMFEKIGITCEEMKDKKAGIFMKFWISDLGNAKCASADRNLPKTCSIITS